MSCYEDIEKAAQYILEHTKQRPKLAIICGSGLSGLGDFLQDVDVILYKDIPNFPISTAPFHKSQLMFGKIKGTISVMVMLGRFHLYEGHSIQMCGMPVRVMKLCGIERLIVTNAAGGLNQKYFAGDIMIIKDHVNMPSFVGINPMNGPNDDRFGERFFGMSCAYDVRWRKLAMSVAREMQIKDGVYEGVYAFYGGPNFETQAEIRMLITIGVDAVGMSTVPEVLVARHCDISVFAFSLITDKCVLGDNDSVNEPNVTEIIEMANSKTEQLKEFVYRIVTKMEQYSD